MKQLVVISGKGGTGKTSLIASFVSLAGTCVISDCDVDAADLHLLLDHRLIQEEDFYALEIAKIDEKLCSKCGLCEQNCRFQAISDYQVDPMICEGCGVCSFVCPENAISTYPKAVGKIITSETPYGAFIHGRLNPGSSNSGRMVTRIREMALEKAKRLNAELILVDGSPGIGCPVIASITGADLVLVVTEPTLSGIHDLERVISLAEHFRVKCAVIINKFDINQSNSENIEMICAQAKMPILGKIPFDTIFIDAMLAGLPLTEYSHESVSKIVRKVWMNACDISEITVQENIHAV